MTAQQESYPTVEFLIGRFVDWLKHRRELSEIRRMNRTDFDLIAQDLRVLPEELDRLVEAGPHSADEMPKMLEALGIDMENLERTQPLLVRDMQRVCSLCRDKAHCHGDLNAGTAPEHYKEYCPNAPAIDVLDKPVKH